MKPVDLKNFVFDWEMCFYHSKVYRFQNLVGMEIPIKHTLGIASSNRGILYTNSSSLAAKQYLQPNSD